MKCKCVEGTPTVTTELAAGHWSRSELVSVRLVYLISSMLLVPVLFLKIHCIP